MVELGKCKTEIKLGSCTVSAISADGGVKWIVIIQQILEPTVNNLLLVN